MHIPVLIHYSMILSCIYVYRKCICTIRMYSHVYTVLMYVHTYVEWMSASTPLISYSMYNIPYIRMYMCYTFMWFCYDTLSEVRVPVPQG